DTSTGLVHISEIDNNFVRDVNEYFQINDEVTVKVLAQGDRGRLELSVKQAVGKEAQDIPMNTSSANGSGGGGHRGGDRAAFEEKMSDYLRISSERLSDIKQNVENRRGGAKKQ
ncbi:MAG: S1 RNA-binding domain-containing protein, partial [Abditibacteriaceae bacterium]